MTIAVGSRLGPYEIVAALGAGGMGEVWRARDPRLDREVAIKLVRGDRFDEERRRRFEREARAIGRLQHPNLLVVHDVGEHDGNPYLVTELLLGATLRDRLADGPPSVELVIRWAREMAAGLSAAHARHVVHRDLKPENVFVTAGGQVKLLDFGLAKRLAGPDDETSDGLGATHMTEPGLVVGTCGYMAPEQVRGQWVDARADQFAFGAILFELLAGRAPFARDAPLESLAAILADPAPPLPATVPAPLVAIVLRCLEKEPARRFPDTGALLAALAAVDPVPRAGSAELPGAAARSVAVLPFRDLSNAADADDLGLGIADAIVTELAAAKALVVRPTSAILRFRGLAIDASAAGRELGVDAVLDGRFQRAGNRLRVTVQLLESANAHPLWATKIDSSLDDPFRMQDEISRRVADALAGELAPRAAATNRAALAPGAYELYLRGRALLTREDFTNTNLAVDSLEAAVAADPRFALGWAWLADAYLMLHLEFHLDDAWYRRAEEACAKALELEPELPEGRYLRGRLAWSSYGGWDHARALTECAAAVAARPGLHEAWHRLGTVLAHVSLLEESSACFERAHRINPHDWASYLIWGYCRLLELRYEEALAMTERVWSESPSPWVAYQRIQCRLHLGRMDEARHATEAAARQFPDSPLVLSMSALLAAIGGDAAEAHRQLEAVDRRRGGLNHFHHAEYEAASALAHLGESAAALEQLSAAARDGFPCVDYFVRDPLLAPLRAEPGFHDLRAALERERDGYRALWAELAVDV